MWILNKIVSYYIIIPTVKVIIVPISLNLSGIENVFLVTIYTEMYSQTMKSLLYIYNKVPLSRVMFFFQQNYMITLVIKMFLIKKIENF